MEEEQQTKSDNKYSNVRYEHPSNDTTEAEAAAMEIQSHPLPDPNDDMRLVPYRRTPPIQIGLSLMAFTAMIFAMVALIYDEISDGDVTFISEEYIAYNSYYKEIDYDCGWEKWTVTQKYTDGYEYSEMYYYSKSECVNQFESDTESTNDDLENFCSEMKQHGLVWISLSVIGVLGSFTAMIVVWRYGPKSVGYFMATMVSVIMYSAASLNWLTNERCTDIEHWSDGDVMLDTSMGISLILMFTAVGVALIAALVSSAQIGLDMVAKRHRQIDMMQIE